MTNHLKPIGRELPYHLPEGDLDALHERIRRKTTHRQAPAGRKVDLRRVALGAAACAAVAVVAVFLAGRYQPVVPQPKADVEQLLVTASNETLQQAAAENYDDLFNTQL